MSRGSSGDLSKTIRPSNNVYTVLSLVGFLAVAAALTIIIMKSQILFGDHLLFK